MHHHYPNKSDFFKKTKVEKRVNEKKEVKFYSLEEKQYREQKVMIISYYIYLVILCIYNKNKPIISPKFGVAKTKAWRSYMSYRFY